MPATHSHKKRQQSAEQIARTRRLHIVLLALLVLLVFASTLGGGFVWTDREDLIDGQHRLQRLSDIPAALSQTREAFRERDVAGTIGDTGSGSWQPLTILSNTVSWSLWGECSVCFHIENVLLHLLVVVGLYALGRHVLSQQRHGTRIAAWSAALYAIHPTTVTSVAWIGGRPYLLAAVFGVWSLVFFTYLQATTKSRHGHFQRWQLAMGLSAGAAMLAHETAYLLPVLALLIAGFESNQRGRSAVFGIAPKRWTAMALLSGVLGLILLYRYLVLGGLGFSGGFPAQSLIDNIGTGLRHFWYLISEAILPGEPVISDAWRVSQGWGAIESLALLGLVAGLVAILAGLKLGQPVAFGAGWLVLWLIPGVGLFPSDHYHSSQTLYLAGWGVAVAVGYLLFRLWRPIGRELVPGSEAVVYIPILIVLAVITAFSNARWWSHDALFESEIAHDPHYMEGRVELAKSALVRGDAAAAMTHAMAAIEASQDKSFTGYWSPRDTYFLLARAQWEQGMMTEAARNFDTALEYQPQDAELFYWRGVSRLGLEEFDGAEEDLRRALTLREPFPEAVADLGVLMAQQARYVEAYPLLSEALNSGLTGFERHAAMARVLIDAGELDASAAQLELALALREVADERARLAWVYWQLDQRDRALQDLNMALQLEETTSPYVDEVRRALTEPSAPQATPSESQ